MTARRRLLLALGAAPLTAALPGFAQQPGRIWRIGALQQRGRPNPIESDFTLGPFVSAMRELGYVEGKNLAIEWRFLDGNMERAREMAAELVRLKPDVIVSASTPTTGALQKATSTIPIVMTTIGDPVGSGFVKSLARPGGNITGLTNMVVEISVKHFELLAGLMPKLSRVAVLSNPLNSSNPETARVVQAAAQKSGVKVLPIETRTQADIENGFSAMAREKVGAVILAQDGLFIIHRRLIAELALKHRLPTAAAIREFADAGILLSYGPSFGDIYRRAAVFVDKILKGAKPADLPVERPTKFEMYINGSTAKKLGVTIPQSMLVQADKVIE